MSVRKKKIKEKRIKILQKKKQLFSILKFKIHHDALSISVDIIL